MAKCTIGGVTYTIPELNFIALERAWPFIEESMVSGDPIKGPSAGLGVIAAGLTEAENFDKTKFNISPEETDEDKIFEQVIYFLKKKLKASEIHNIIDCMNEITREAGLESDEGPPEPPVAGDQMSLSKETAQNSSPNLSQLDVKEEVGTE